jgi:phosphatidylglycerophosphatase A
MSRVARLLATWFGCGFAPVAPGTAGSFGALPVFFGAHALGGRWAVAAVSVVLTFVGIWSADVVAKELGTKDPQIIVIDEVAGVLIALAFCPFDWLGITVAFVAFRAFDTLKIWPANVLEKRLPGGWGIVLDDVGAGAWVAAIFCALQMAGVV